MGEEGIYIYIYLTLHCHRQNDSCIKMASGVSHFNVSFIAEKTKSLSDSVHEFKKRNDSRRGIKLMSVCLPA